MSSPASLPPKDAKCVKLSQELDRGMRFLWMPGRRDELAGKSYGVGHDCRHNGNIALAEANFRRVLLLLQDSPQDGSDKSLKRHSIVAAAHNHLGLLCLDDGRPAEGAPSFDRAIDIRRDLRRRFPKDRENEVYLGGALCNRAHSVADPILLLPSISTSRACQSYASRPRPVSAAIGTRSANHGGVSSWRR